MRHAKTLLALLALAVSFGCAQPRYALHTAYRLTGCGQVIDRAKLGEGLIRRGYLRSSEPRGPYEIFRKPVIVKKGALAAEPYEDRAGDIAVAVCPAASEQFILVEEWTSCKGRKDCTKENQKELRALVEQWGCTVSEKSAHSESWKLEDRQDWTKESCSFIATNLIF